MPDSENETAATLEPEAAPDPKELSTEYHKAHKQLMLWSTVLFIWELVGVDLEKAKDAGGYVGPVVTALKSPQAVPWVLLILVLYFLFKCSIEWAQCHPERRRVRFARIDFISAWVVSVAALALYAGQAISRVQFADRLSYLGNAEGLSLLFILNFYVLSKGVVATRRTRAAGRRLSWMAITQICFALFSTILPSVLLATRRLPGTLIVTLGAIGVTLAIWDFYRLPIPKTWHQRHKKG